jgi:NAD(P)-dependent dehydrogenase (short-subunit alcohol dehydrogenase family)
LGGKAALVTGAGSGIGAAVAERFASEGAFVFVADLDHESAIATVEQIAGSARALQVDVGDESSVSALIQRADDERPLDILVNVAGIGSTTTAPATSLDVWNAVMRVNATGTFLCCKHLLPRMIERRRGSVINVASVAGLVGLRNRAAYCASKGAVVALTRALAVDHVGQGVRVNCICPGTVDSPWVRRLVAEHGESVADLSSRQPMGRLGTTSEIADAAAYLAGDDASFTTGMVMTVDGGLTAG